MPVSYRPPRDSYSPFDPEDLVIEQLDIVSTRLKLVFERFGLKSGKKRLQKVLKTGKDNRLWELEEPPWHSGDYGLVVLLNELIDNYVFAYAESDDVSGSSSMEYYQLLRVLRNLEGSLAITRAYPREESEFHTMVESILACTFPKLRNKPSLTTAIKNFFPDTGIPEARTLIEYKYIKERKQIPERVDEIFADFIGYKNSEWTNIVYVIYETERFVPEEKWRDQLKKLKETEVVVVRGIPTQEASA